MRVVQLALCVVERALDLELGGTQRVELFAGCLQLRFQHVDLFGQRADLTLTRQHADLAALCTTYACPARAQPFAATGDHRLIRRQRG